MTDREKLAIVLEALIYADKVLFEAQLPSGAHKVTSQALDTISMDDGSGKKVDN